MEAVTSQPGPEGIKTTVSPEQLRELDKREDERLEWFVEAANQVFTGHFLWKLDHYNEPVVRKMIQYFMGSPRFLEPKARCGGGWVNVQMSSRLSFSKGICLIGMPGTGKDCIFMVFAAMLRALNHPDAYSMVNCQELAQLYERKGMEPLEKYGYESFANGPSGLVYDRPRHYCFRDLGAERDVSHYGNRTSVMVDIIQARNDVYYHGLKTHATSNMSEREMGMRYGVGIPRGEITDQAFEQGADQRVLRRIRQMMNRIILPGPCREM